MVLVQDHEPIPAAWSCMDVELIFQKPCQAIQERSFIVNYQYGVFVHLELILYQFEIITDPYPR